MAYVFSAESSHSIVSQGLQVLRNLDHRGAICENSGDGAGIMIAMPHAFFQEKVKEENLGFSLPSPGDYAEAKRLNIPVCSLYYNYHSFIHFVGHRMEIGAYQQRQS